MKLTAKVSVEGTRTVLFHTFPIEALSEKKSKSGTGAGNYPEEWKQTVLMGENRQLYFFPSYFFASIKEGGKEIKVGKGNISKKVASTLEVLGTKLFLDDLFVPEGDNLTKDDTQPVYLDIRSVVNPMTKGRNLRYRIAARAGWTCSFIITWDDYLVSKDNMRVCVENGGMFQGVGDGRGIGFGRYKVTSFKVLD